MYYSRDIGCWGTDIRVHERMISENLLGEWKEGADVALFNYGIRGARFSRRSLCFLEHSNIAYAGYQECLCTLLYP